MKFPLPRTSFNTIKLVIEAGYISNKDIITTFEWKSFIKGKNLYEAVIRSCPFLTELGLLVRVSRSSYQLTDTFLLLGSAIRNREKENERKIWLSTIENNEFFKKVIDNIDFYQDKYGFVETRVLKEEIIRLSGWEESSRNIPNYFEVYAPTIMNMLKYVEIIEHIDKLKVRRTSTSFKKAPVFISTDHIYRLKKITNKDFDLSRLIRYCEQINDNYASGNFESVAFLSRALIQHIPPVFGQPNFESVGSQTSSGKDTSFKKSCIHLQNSLKHIVDDLIHAPITKRQIPISSEETDFSQDLNRLIREIIDQL